MNDQQRQYDENQRLLKERQEQQERDEQERRDQEQRHNEKVQLDKKTFEDKKLDQQRSADESKRVDDKRRDDKKLADQRRTSGQPMPTTPTVDSVQADANETDPSKKPGVKPGVDKAALTDDTKDLSKSSGEKPVAAASQTPLGTPENKPSFAAPKAEDPKLAKPTTAAERAAIRNMEMSLANERAGRTRPPAHTVERAEQAEAKLQQSQEASASQTKKAEQRKSPTMEKTQ